MPASRSLTSNQSLICQLGVYAYGFERPSAIQQRAIMPVIKGLYLPHQVIRFSSTKFLL